MYFRLSWKTWKALFINLESVLLYLFSAIACKENIFSTEPIVEFLDLFMLYSFGYICE